MHKIEPFALEKIENTINKYSMFQKDDRIIVALSGGKDSLYTSFALIELGYIIQPVIIDMGYDGNWGKNIVKMFTAYDIIPQVIEVRNATTKNHLTANLQKDIRANLKFLHNFKPNNYITPCTMCYNTKIILLSKYAQENQIYKIVFGHHGSDAITSFLKSALMYIDRWENMNEVYVRNNFHNLINTVRPVFLGSFTQFIKSPFSKQLEDLTAMKLISTDEPPVQLYKNDRSITILRPLFKVFENTIINFKKNHNLKTLGSGCSHSFAKETHTPREMIQYELLYLLFENPDNELIQDWLISLVINGLESDGTLIVNARNERENILGKQYKSTKGCEIKL
ncbi:MAG: hypothetical protein MUE93_00405 [Ignavibacteriaceae bacterium]|jgi:tRNA(Ile)-lysidine synthase TilS/MesJ|nr:hypothetical protein [Ignavibacterium sp.]MCU0364124.1 hypothetical protein [Ignavibacteriaceae bacterium]